MRCPVGAPNKTKETNNPGIFRPGFFLVVERSFPYLWERPGVFISTKNVYAPRGAFSKYMTVYLHSIGVDDLWWWESAATNLSDDALKDLTALAELKSEGGILDEQTYHTSKKPPKNTSVALHAIAKYEFDF